MTIITLARKIGDCDGDAETIASVEHKRGEVILGIKTSYAGQHTTHTVVVIDDPEHALELAEGLREAAVSAQVYIEHDPN